MGINMMKKGIINLNICNNAAIKEILNRKKRYLHEYRKGRESKKTVKRMTEIIKQLKELQP